MSTDRSAGRSVVVVGMHRSGTSAVTRVVNLLGVPLGRPDDLYRAPDNPSGHFESVSLCAANDAILAAFGGTDTCPPRLAPGWEHSPTADRLLPALQAVFRYVYAEGPWLWKDPRVCLTLPLWRRVLDEFCVVFVVRSVEAVVGSLHRRQGFPPLYCRALWERYNRSALAAMDGLPVVTVSFDHLVQAPVEQTAELARRLKAVGVDGHGSVEEAAASLDTSVARPAPRWQSSFLTAPLERAVQLLPDLSETFRPPRLPAVSAPWAPVAFATARTWLAVRGPEDRRAARTGRDGP